MRSQRLKTIRKLIGRGKVSSQEELMKLLSGEGFLMTQATLSRDLKFLRVAKMPDGVKGYIYVLPDSEWEEHADKLNPVPLTGFVSVSFAQGMALIKTWSGFAQSVASIIDSWNLWEIAGTIAGDDTILIIPRDGISKEDLIESLGEFMPEITAQTI